ncbi:hypothetical protein DRO61_05125, partial [Candidatus Bathyarchaeota archaeon]
YNEGQLIQFSGFLFKRIEPDIYQIYKSLNRYVKLEYGNINRFIRDFTGITDIYLESFGITLDDAREQIYKLLDEPGLLVVSHGLYNDRQTMLGNGIDMYFNGEKEEIEGSCTYSASKRLLDREKKLTLADVAQDAGVFLSNHHNAFDDAWATIAVYSLLSKLQEEKKIEKTSKKIL